MGNATMQLALLDHRFHSQGEGFMVRHSLAQKLAELQRESSEREKIQIAAQVERIREIEVGKAREQESAKWMREMTQEREELMRLCNERVSRIREQEDAAMSRAREVQREAEQSVFQLRQRMVAEDDRMRVLLQERERDLASRESANAAREAALEAREQRVAEALEESRRRSQEAAAQASAAKQEARRLVESELAAERANLRAQRVAFEDERARVMAMRDEISDHAMLMAEKDARIEALLVAKADAETRASATTAEMRLLQSHTSRLLHELDGLQHDVLGFGVGCTADIAAVSGKVIGSALQAVSSSTTGLARLHQEFHSMRQRTKAALAHEQDLHCTLERCQQDLAVQQSKAAAAQAEVSSMLQSIRESQELLHEAREGRELALAQAEDCRLALRHAEAELRAAEASLSAAKADRDGAIAAVGGMFVEAPLASCGESGILSEPENEAVGYSLQNNDPQSSATIVREQLHLLELEEQELQVKYSAFHDKVSKHQVSVAKCIRAAKFCKPMHEDFSAVELLRNQEQSRSSMLCRSREEQIPFHAATGINPTEQTSTFPEVLVLPEDFVQDNRVAPFHCLAKPGTVKESVPHSSDVECPTQPPEPTISTMFSLEPDITHIASVPPTEPPQPPQPSYSVNVLVKELTSPELGCAESCSTESVPSDPEEPVLPGALPQCNQGEVEGEGRMVSCEVTEEVDTNSTKMSVKACSVALDVDCASAASKSAHSSTTHELQESKQAGAQPDADNSTREPEIHDQPALIGVCTGSPNHISPLSSVASDASSLNNAHSSRPSSHKTLSHGTASVEPESASHEIENKELTENAHRESSKDSSSLSAGEESADIVESIVATSRVSSSQQDVDSQANKVHDVCQVVALQRSACEPSGSSVSDHSTIYSSNSVVRFSFTSVDYTMADLNTDVCSMQVESVKLEIAGGVEEVDSSSCSQSSYTASESICDAEELAELDTLQIHHDYVSDVEEEDMDYFD